MLSAVRDTMPESTNFFLNQPLASGAAGNFLAPISGMSENAFKTVMEIDTVCFPSRRN